MAPLPPQDTTITRIWKSWVDRDKGYMSDSIGAASIGDPCERKLWLAFRWSDREEFEGRMLKLFRRGDLEEAVIVSDLRAIGAEVLDKDPETGKQWRFTALGGHFVCKIDAAITGLVEAPKTWHVGEFKTHNDKSFTKLRKDGVVVTKPTHAAQMQAGMGLAGMDRAVYIAVNKNDDDLHLERLEYDAQQFKDLIAKAERVIFSEEPRPGLSDSPAHFACKFCNMHAVCHAFKFPMATCRSCVYSTPEREGGWSCKLHQKPLTRDEQKAGCPSHLFIPPMLRQEPVDSATGWIQYKDFANVADNAVDPPTAVPHMTSAELSQRPVDQLPSILAVKQHLGGAVTGAS